MGLALAFAVCESTVADDAYQKGYDAGSQRLDSLDGCEDGCLDPRFVRNND